MEKTQWKTFSVLAERADETNAELSQLSKNTQTVVRSLDANLKESFRRLELDVHSFQNTFETAHKQMESNLNQKYHSTNEQLNDASKNVNNVQSSLNDIHHSVKEIPKQIDKTCGNHQGSDETNKEFEVSDLKNENLFEFFKELFEMLALKIVVEAGIVSFTISGASVGFYVLITIVYQKTRCLYKDLYF